MIIIHNDEHSGNMLTTGIGGTPTTTTTTSTTGGGFRVVRPQRKDWVRFDTSSDSENEEDSLQNIEIDSETNRLNLQLDLDNFESVEIKLIKKRKESQLSQKTSTRLITTSDVLVRNLEILRQSGFYYEKGDYNGETCTKLLSKTPPGTFLVRTSSDPNYLFTLSLQTERGPTSVRLVFWSTGGNSGEFRLDAADHRLIGVLPGFKSVVQLVQYYVEENNSSSFKGNGKKKVERVKSGNRQVWIDSATGRQHSAVKLTTPLRQEVLSLKHLSRLALNNLNCDTVMLPEPVKKYLNDYPFVL